MFFTNRKINKAYLHIYESARIDGGIDNDSKYYDYAIQVASCVLGTVARSANLSNVSHDGYISNDNQSEVIFRIYNRTDYGDYNYYEGKNELSRPLMILRNRLKQEDTVSRRPNDDIRIIRNIHDSKLVNDLAHELVDKNAFKVSIEELDNDEERFVFTFVKHINYVFNFYNSKDDKYVMMGGDDDYIKQNLFCEVDIESGFKCSSESGTKYLYKTLRKGQRYDTKKFIDNIKGPNFVDKDDVVDDDTDECVECASGNSTNEASENDEYTISIIKLLSRLEHSIMEFNNEYDNLTSVTEIGLSKVLNSVILLDKLAQISEKIEDKTDEINTLAGTIKRIADSLTAKISQHR